MTRRAKAGKFTEEDMVRSVGRAVEHAAKEATDRANAAPHNAKAQERANVYVDTSQKINRAIQQHDAENPS